MAGERTEAPSPKKISDARKQGQIARSADLSAGLNLLAAALVLRTVGPRLWQDVISALRTQFSQVAVTDWGTGVWQDSLLSWLHIAGLAMAPIFAVLLGVGLLAGGLQTGFNISSDALTLKLDRLNPLAGLQRLFSQRALVDLAKSLLKISVVGIAGWQAGQQTLDLLPTLADSGLAAAAAMLFGVGGDLLLKAGVLLTVLGAADYGYQWWDHMKNLRMSKEEVKKEHKEQEGSPEIRQRRRQRMRELARRHKMLKAVPTASVVVTNPTHFAVALRYQPGVEQSPVVVAKGQDAFASQIRRLAGKHRVPVVEDPPLARALYKSTAVGHEIPPDFYRAVARIFAFIDQVRATP